MSNTANLSANLSEDQQDALAELVHDQAAQIGSDVINQGQHVDYLRSNGWTQAQVDAAALGDLDETVHDVASQTASDAINSGEGWDFLLTYGWTGPEITAALTGE